MSTWAGWQVDLLDAAGITYAESHGEFLTEWHNHAASDCRNNPVDISQRSPGATNCHKLTSSRTAKNYTSHAAGASAFAAQITSGSFPHLLRALRANVPLNEPSPQAVADDIDAWGSPSFAAWYLAHSSVGSGGGIGAPPTLKPAQALRGWGDLQRSVNRHMHDSLTDSQRLRRAALRKLSKARKVKL